MVFATPSYAQWTKVAEATTGDIFYLDFGRIREHQGYVYYWTLQDNLKPDRQGNISYILYEQGDCQLFRTKPLSFVFYTGPMGSGSRDSQTSLIDDWQYPTPNSLVEDLLKTVCDAVGK